MNTKTLDIVYCCKNSVNNEELRYSLRSLKNLPHRNIWIYGGIPNWAKGVYHVPYKQDQATKWNNTREILKLACQNPRISDDFIWFNDDFFVLQPISKLEYYYCADLQTRALATMNQNTFALSKYGTRLLQTQGELEQHHKDTKNFEIHCPIIYNKSKALACLNKYPISVLPRSLYCNHYRIEATEHPDCKIEDINNRFEGNWLFASTSDKSFASGEAGRQIRGIFNFPSPYEDTWAGLSMSPGFKTNRV